MLKFFVNIAKKIKPWGFRGLSTYDVAIFFWKGLMEGAITTRASSLAFNFFLAFFPSIIVFFTLIPYIPIQGLQKELMKLLNDVLPELTNEIAFSALDDIINTPRGDLLSIGFILAVYFSTNGINSLIAAFNASYHVKETRSLFQQRLLSLGLTVLLSLMLIIALTSIIFEKSAVNYLTKKNMLSDYSEDLILYGKWGTMLVMLFLGISILFNLGPAIKNKWRIFTPGSIFATIFMITTSIGFNYYINHLGFKYNHIYGSIGTLMIILLWIYFNSIILLTGFELNASISNAKEKEEDLE